MNDFEIPLTLTRPVSSFSIVKKSFDSELGRGSPLSIYQLRIGSIYGKNLQFTRDSGNSIDYMNHSDNGQASFVATIASPLAFVLNRSNSMSVSNFTALQPLERRTGKRAYIQQFSISHNHSRSEEIFQVDRRSLNG